MIVLTRKWKVSLIIIFWTARMRRLRSSVFMSTKVFAIFVLLSTKNFFSRFNFFFTSDTPTHSKEVFVVSIRFATFWKTCFSIFVEHFLRRTALIKKKRTQKEKEELERFDQQKNKNKNKNAAHINTQHTKEWFFPHLEKTRKNNPKTRRLFLIILIPSGRNPS